MNQRIVFATTNEGKMSEIREILSDCGYDILSMKEAGICAEADENGSTFEENASSKTIAGGYCYGGRFWP